MRTCCRSNNHQSWRKSLNLVPSAVVGKLVVALVALFFIDTFELKDNDIYIIPAMCILCVAIPFVLVTLKPRYITEAEVNLFFLMETVLGPIWVWMVVKEQPSSKNNSRRSGDHFNNRYSLIPSHKKNTNQNYLARNLLILKI